MNKQKKILTKEPKITEAPKQDEVGENDKLTVLKSVTKTKNVLPKKRSLLYHHKILIIIFSTLIIGGALSWLIFVGLIKNSALKIFQTKATGIIKNINLNSQETVQENSNIRKLDGIFVSPEKNNPYPIAVMIENMSVVRPQSGLASASIVYETLAEGGITRFLAIFPGGDSQVKEIGPVRSSRDYYIEWVSEYDALYAHCGGSPQALQSISAFNIKDLNQIGGDHPYFWRQSGLGAPHNLFTSSELLTKALRDKQLDKIQPNYESWKFKDDLNLTERPAEVPEITINWNNSRLYQVVYHYRTPENDYLRSHDKSPHLDANTGDQISAKNVIVIRLPQEGSYGEKGRIQLDLHGEGEAIIFRDGKTVKGSWRKPDRSSRTKFFDSNNKEIELNRGNVWIEIVPGEREVTYQ